MGGKLTLSHRKQGIGSAYIFQWAFLIIRFGVLRLLFVMGDFPRINVSCSDNLDKWVRARQNLQNHITVDSDQPSHLHSLFKVFT